MKYTLQKERKAVREFFNKPYRFAAIFSAALTIAVLLVMLDTFVIPHVGVVLSAELSASSAANGEATETSDGGAASGSGEDAGTSSAPVVTNTSYQDANIQITITTLRKYDTNIYIADVRLSDISYLKTAFASNTYGRNIKETTSAIASAHQAILAINGDYYGFRNTGFVIRNGVLYRSSGDGEALCIDGAGNFSIVDESSANAAELLDQGILQALSFGPALIDGGVIKVTASSEVGQSMASNPRTAIGQISALHYIFVVSDGRTDESAGLSLLELAQIMKDQGCETAYNLDGGGSSTMWFNGEVVNNPTDGRSESERSVSDIVYIG